MELEGRISYPRELLISVNLQTVLLQPAGGELCCATHPQDIDSGLNICMCMQKGLWTETESAHWINEGK